MPELPVLSGGDVIGVLERLGSKQGRQRGSDVILRRGTVGCVVPLHDLVKRGTLAGILGQARLSRDDFLGAVK